MNTMLTQRNRSLHRPSYKDNTLIAPILPDQTYLSEQAGALNNFISPVRGRVL